MRTGLRSRAAAAAACLACAIASAAELGTLFSTPEERDRLDRLRRGEPAPSAASHPGSSTPQVTGFVKRSDGRDTVWIDGRPQPMGPASAQYTDPSKVQDARRADAPPIEIRRTK